jgi:hypothetical protein
MAMNFDGRGRAVDLFCSFAFGLHKPTNYQANETDDTIVFPERLDGLNDFTLLVASSECKADQQAPRKTANACQHREQREPRTEEKKGNFGWHHLKAMLLRCTTLTTLSPSPSLRWSGARWGLCNMRF